MGRKAKYDVSDLELLWHIKRGHTLQERQKAMDDLFFRYEALIMKRKGILAKTAYEHHYIIDTSDYLSGSYETFCKAVKTIDLDRLCKARGDKIKSWKFYICFDGYLRSHNRDIIYNYIKDRKNTVEIHSITGKNGEESTVTNLDTSAINKGFSAEEQVFENDQKKVFWEAVNLCIDKKFTPIQVQIWNSKNDQEKVLGIARKVGIKQKEVLAELDKIREVFAQTLEEVSKREKVDTDYLPVLQRAG